MLELYDDLRKEKVMSSFFLNTAQSRLEGKLEKYPLLKLDQVLDWKNISDLLYKTKAGQINLSKSSGYDLLKMFKAVLLGQWHSLSDPELERSLLVRIDFILFCNFDDTEIPDETTLCRYRNWLEESNLMPKLLGHVNAQLQKHKLQVKEAKTAIVAASIISTAGSKQPKNPIVNEDGEVTDPPKSKDEDAKWVKKGAHFYLGYKLHAMTDDKGYFKGGYVTAANEHESKHLRDLISPLDEGVRVQADKGYAGYANRTLIKDFKLKDGIMHKAKPGKKLRPSQNKFNRLIKKTRYVVEQSFGTMKRIFNFYRASYFSKEKVQAQSIFKMICVNLLKAANMVSLSRV
jgi:IS5 family transposase